MIPLEVILYFCTSLFLINSGFVFILPLFFKTKEDYDVVKNIFLKNSLYVFIGFLGLILCVFLLFLPMANIIIVGDIIPVIIVLINSVMYLFGYIRLSKYLDEKIIQRGERILENIQIPLGFVSLLAGFVHIFFAKILFL